MSFQGPQILLPFFMQSVTQSFCTGSLCLYKIFHTWLTVLLWRLRSHFLLKWNVYQPTWCHSRRWKSSFWGCENVRSHVVARNRFHDKFDLPISSFVFVCLWCHIFNR
jgi:hypothetical protein